MILYSTNRYIYKLSKILYFFLNEFRTVQKLGELRTANKQRELTLIKRE